MDSTRSRMEAIDEPVLVADDGRLVSCCRDEACGSAFTSSVFRLRSIIQCR